MILLLLMEPSALVKFLSTRICADMPVALPPSLSSDKLSAEGLVNVQVKSLSKAARVVDAQLSEMETRCHVPI